MNDELRAQAGEILHHYGEAHQQQKYIVTVHNKINRQLTRIREGSHEEP